MLIPTFLKLNCVLIVICLSMPSSQETQIFENKDPEIDFSEFQKEKYKDITYKEFIAMRPKMIINPNVAHEHQLNRMYPDIVPNYCEGSVCLNPIYELVNQKLGKSKISSLPTILLVGGINGTETLGIQSLVQFILLVQKLYTKSNKIYKLLNSTRILVIPVINSYGFYYQVEGEKVNYKDEEIMINPKEDFNLFPKKHCFLTSSSQYLRMIFKDFIIFGVFAITKGDFKIDFTRLDDLFGSKVAYSDSYFLNQAAFHIKNTFNIGTSRTNKCDEENLVNDLFDDQNELPIPMVEIELKLEKITDKRNGTFIDWAFGGSEFAVSLSQKCLYSETIFNKDLLKVSSKSNRAIALELKIDKGMVKDFESYMGNELFFLDETHEEGLDGLIPAILLSIESFFDLINQSAVLKKIEFESNQNQGQILQNYNFQFQVHGCLRLYSANIKNKNFESSFKKNLKNSEFLINSDIEVFGTLNEKNFLKKRQEYDLNFGIDCFYDIVSQIKEKDLSISHFMKILLNKEHAKSLSMNGLNTVDLRQLTIRNFIPDLFNKALLLDLGFNALKFIYKTDFLLSTGGFFPIHMFYNVESSTMDYKVIRHNLPAISKKPKKEENFNLQDGIFTRQSDSFKDIRLKEYLNHLRSAEESLALFVFDSYQSYLCSNIKIESIEKYGKSIDRKINAELMKATMTKLIMYKAMGIGKDKIAKDVNIPQMKKTIQDAFKNLHYLEKEQDLFDCPQFQTKKKHLKLDEVGTSLFQSHNSKKMVQSYFLSLLGKIMKIRYQIPIENNEQKFVEVGGRAVLVDPAITGWPSDEKKTLFPLPANVRRMEPYKSQKIKGSKLSCESVSGIFPVSTSDLDQMVVGRKTNKPQIDSFFYLKIASMNFEDRNVEVTLYTNAKIQGNSVILQNKSQSHEMIKIEAGILELPGNVLAKDLAVFQGKFPAEDMRLLGLYIMLFEPKKEVPLFDCFLRTNETDADVKTQYLVYDKIRSEINEIVKEDFEELRKARNSQIIVIIDFVVAFLILIGIGGACWYFFVLRKKEVDQNEELSEPIETNEQS